MDYATLKDEVLIQLVARKNAAALSELYDRYSRLVFGHALQSVGDRETAEEITVDVFMRVWENAASYQADRSKFTTWLMSITRHRAIDILRRRSSRPEQDSVSWADVSADIVPNVTDTPEEVTVQLIRRERVRTAIAQLPDEQAAALALAYFRGYTHREIADVLDAPLGTVKSRIRLAMQKLRRILMDEEPV